MVVIKTCSLVVSRVAAPHTSNWGQESDPAKDPPCVVRGMYTQSLLPEMDLGPACVPGQRTSNWLSCQVPWKRSSG